MTDPVALNDRIWLSGQILPDALAEIASRLGLRKVVNNRPDHEEPGQPASDEIRAAAEAAGLAYLEAPVRGLPDAQTISAVGAFLSDGAPALLFAARGCGRPRPGPWPRRIRAQMLMTYVLRPWQPATTLADCRSNGPGRRERHRARPVRAYRTQRPTGSPRDRPGRRTRRRLGLTQQKRRFGSRRRLLIGLQALDARSAPRAAHLLRLVKDARP